jgi:broad specificity phosphatase PhoE
MKVIIARHGQTDHNKNDFCQGSIDTVLNEEGIRQAELLKEKFQDINIDLVISSPLKRALKTAEIAVTHKEILVDERIKERHLGLYEGVSSKTVSFEEYGHYYLNTDRNGVEKIQDLYERVKSFFEELKNNHEDKTILVVTHGAVYNVIYYYIHGIPEDGILSFKYISNGEYVEYEI